METVGWAQGQRLAQRIGRVGPRGGSGAIRWTGRQNACNVLRPTGRPALSTQPAPDSTTRTFGCRKARYEGAALSGSANGLLQGFGPRSSRRFAEHIEPRQAPHSSRRIRSRPLGLPAAGRQAYGLGSQRTVESVRLVPELPPLKIGGQVRGLRKDRDAEYR